MRELTVYCCPDCGRYGFYQISRNAVCPICSRPMTALPVSYQIFMELDLEERSQLIAKQKERPAFKAAPGESASGESDPCNGSATNTDTQKQTEAKPDAQAPGTQDPDAQAPGKRTPRIEETDRRIPDMQKPRKNTQKTKCTPKAARSSHACRTAAAGKPAPEPAIKPALRRPSLPSGNSFARKIRNCCARNASWSTPCPGCTT